MLALGFATATAAALRALPAVAVFAAAFFTGAFLAAAFFTATLGATTLRAAGLEVFAFLGAMLFFAAAFLAGRATTFLAVFFAAGLAACFTTLRASFLTVFLTAFFAVLGGAARLAGLATDFPLRRGGAAFLAAGRLRAVAVFLATLVAGLRVAVQDCVAFFAATFFFAIAAVSF